jgi:protein gp37
MAETTKIAWATSTWNPWIGCTKVSIGCAHCYAENNMAAVMRQGGRVKWGAGQPRAKTKDWGKILTWNRRAEKTGESIQVFPSLCDVFDADPVQKDVLDEWRQELFDLVRATPALTWLLLTKRPEVAAQPRWTEQIAKFGPKVWIGTSVENQAAAELRMPVLLNQIPARKKFVSAEPLLGPLNLTPWIGGVQWVIVGGESKKDARTMELPWARDVRNQCAQAGSKFFFKQVGGSDADKGGNLLDGEEIQEVPEWDAAR